MKAKSALLLLFLGATPLSSQGQADIPQLEVRRFDDLFVELRWPIDPPGFVLEETIDPSDPEFWSLVPQTPGQTAAEFSLLVDTIEPLKFFRLRQETGPVNSAPELAELADLTLPLGRTLTLHLDGSDPDPGDALTFGVHPMPLPVNARLNAVTGEFVFKPQAGQAGEYRLTFSVTDGRLRRERTITITVPEPVAGAATALSGRVLDANAAAGGQEVPIQGVVVSLLGTGREATTLADGSFRIINAPAGAQVLDFAAGGASPAPNGDAYANFRERFELLEGVDNVIERPVYLPRLAAASMTTVNPAATTMVRNDALGVEIMVPPNTAKGQDGADFTGQLSISPVPPDLAPMALPDFLEPAMLVTIQPVGVTFATPVPITFPNSDALPPGSELDIWSLDPGSGQFAVVGTGRVSADGSKVETIAGGVRAADWHADWPPDPEEDEDDYPPPGTPPPGDDWDKKCDKDSGSRVALARGTLLTEFTLPEHVSMGLRRGLRFVYESERAHPFPLLPAHLVNRLRSAVPRSISYKLSVGGVDLGMETFLDPSVFDENADERYRLVAGCEASGLPTGSYPYTLRVTNHFNISRISADLRGRLSVVNQIESPFGAGWGLAGLQKIHVAEDGSALLVDGDGGNVLFSSPTQQDMLLRDVGGTSIQRFDGATGAPLGTFINGLTDAQTPTFGPDGNVYVMTGAGRGRSINRYNPDTGALIDVFVRPTGGAQSIVDFAFGPDGNIYLTDGATVAVYRFSGEDGRFLGIAAQGQGMRRPCGIAFSPPAPVGEGLLHVLDQGPSTGTNDDRILSFDGATGAFIREVVPMGTLRNVCWFSVGPEDTIYVPDVSLTTVYKWNAGDGQTLGVIPAFGAPLSSVPFSARLGPDGFLHVSRGGPGGAEIVRFDPQSGDFIDVFVTGTAGVPGWFPGAEGGQANQFGSPEGDHSSLVQTIDGGFRRTMMDGQVSLFDADGFLQSVTDRNGNTETFTYDDEGLLTEWKDPAGLKTTLAYESGRLVAVTDPAGRTTSFRHGPTGDLVQVSFSDASSHRFGYDGRHLMISERDGRGQIVRREYDRTGRFVKSMLPDGSERRATNVQAVGLVDPASGKGSSANPAPVTRPDEAVATFINGAGEVESFLTGRFDDGIAATDAAGLTTISERDRDGNIVRFDTPAGVRQTSTFDADGNLLSSTDETFGGTTSYNYLPGTDLVDTETDPFGGITRRTYDAQGNELLVTTPEGRTRQTAYRADGLVETATSELGATTTLAYDGLGNVATEILGAGDNARTTSYIYTAAGEVGTQIDALGRTTDWTYDALGRKISERRPDDLLVSYGWDADGNPASITPPGRGAHRFAYTYHGELTEYLPPGAVAPVRYSYDGAMRLIGIERPDAKNLDFQYDLTGRLAVLDSSVAGRTEYSYDPATGNVETATAPDGIELAYEYIGGLVTKTIWSGPIAGSVTIARDEAARIQSIQVNDRAPIAYQYDGDGLITSAGALALTLDPDSGLEIGTVLGGVSTETGYNFAGEIVLLRASFGGGDIFRMAYQRDQLGRITSLDEMIAGEARTVGYSYDAAGRLERVTVDGSLTEAYTYDANGNRLAALGLAGAPTYDAQDRLLQYGNATFAYSTYGDLQTRSDGTVTQYIYDESSSLRSFQRSGDPAIEYLIDAERRRVGKQRGDVLVQGLLYKDTLEPVAETDGAGNVEAEFVTVGNRVSPDYMLKGGRTYRILTDHLGSIRLVVDAASGAVAQRIDYDTFGIVTRDTSPGFQPFGFAGGIYDRDTGLVRFGARDYDPAIGRWTTKDPLLFASGETNLYVYAGNNPINLLDPTGHESEEEKKRKKRDAEFKEVLDQKNYERFIKKWDTFKKDHWDSSQRFWGSDGFLGYYNDVSGWAIGHFPGQPRPSP